MIRQSVRRVRGLKLTDIGPFTSLELDLDADLVLIYAANGAGKTTVARSLGPMLTPSTLVVPTPRRVNGGDEAPIKAKASAVGRVVDASGKSSSFEWLLATEEDRPTDDTEVGKQDLYDAAARLTLLGHAFYDSRSLFRQGRVDTVQGMVAQMAVQRGPVARAWLASASELMQDLGTAIRKRKYDLDGEDALVREAQGAVESYRSVRNRLADELEELARIAGVTETLTAAIDPVVAAWPHVTGDMAVSELISDDRKPRVGELRSAVADERRRLLREVGATAIDSTARQRLAALEDELTRLAPHVGGAAGVLAWLDPDTGSLVDALLSIAEFATMPPPDMDGMPDDVVAALSVAARERELLDLDQVRSLTAAVERSLEWADRVAARQRELREERETLRRGMASEALSAVESRLGHLESLAKSVDEAAEDLSQVRQAQARAEERKAEQVAIGELEKVLKRLQHIDIERADTVLKSAVEVMEALQRTHADALVTIAAQSRHGFTREKSREQWEADASGVSGVERDSLLAQTLLQDEVGRTRSDLSDSEAAQFDVLWSLANRLALRASPYAEPLPGVVVLDDHGATFDLRSTSRDVLLLRRLAYAKTAVLPASVDADEIRKASTERCDDEAGRVVTANELAPDQVIVLTHNRDLYELLLEQLTPPPDRTMRVIVLPREDGYDRTVVPGTYALVPARASVGELRRHIGPVLARTLTWGREERARKEAS